MTEQKKSAAPDTLIETGKNAKIELNEQQLNDVAGGLTFNGMPTLTDKHSPVSLQAASLNFGLKI